MKLIPIIITNKFKLQNIPQLLRANFFNGFDQACGSPKQIGISLLLQFYVQTGQDSVNICRKTWQSFRDFC